LQFDGHPWLLKAKTAPNNANNNNNNNDDNSIIGTVDLLVLSLPTTTSKFCARSPIPPLSYLEVAKQLVRKISHFSDSCVVAGVINLLLSLLLSLSGNNHSSNDRGSNGTFCPASYALFAVKLTLPLDARYLLQKFHKQSK
jgi:hypothetical protein